MADIPELIRRYVADSDQTAFAELVQSHVDLVYSVALRQLAGDSHLAQDVTQEVFLVLARKARGLAGRTTLNGWLYHTAVLAANAAIRREQRRRVREHRAQLEETIMQSHYVAESEDPDWEKARPALDLAVSQLTERERDAILLRFFENRPFSEIGRMLCVSEDAARMRVDRALQKLRVLLGRRGVKSTAAALAVALTGQAVAAAPSGLAAAVTGAVLASNVAAPAVGLINLMTSTKMTVGVVSIAVALALGTATREVLAEHRAQSQLAAADQANNAAASRLRTLERRLQTADRDQVQLQQSLAGANETGSGSPGAAALTSERAQKAVMEEATAKTRALEADHPEVDRAFKTLMKASVAAKYGPLMASLGLTPNQVDQFETLMMGAHIGVGIDGQTFAFSWDGGPTSRSGYPDSALRALLGNSGFQQLQEYDRLNVARTVADRLAGASVAVSSPLSAAQADQITQIVASNSPSYQQGKSVKAASLDWDNTLTQAQGVLTPEQLAALDGIHQQVLFNLALDAAGNASAAASGK